jgi:hypothetical protein
VMFYNNLHGNPCLILYYGYEYLHFESYLLYAFLYSLLPLKYIRK